MANEVVIREYSSVGALKNGSVVPVYEEDNLITTQVLTIAARSAAFNSGTVWISIDSVGTGFWYRFGDSTVNAVANTDGNSPLALNTTRDFKITGHTHVDTAALV